MTKLISHNPATGEVVWQGETASKAEVDAAVKRARLAAKDWMFTDYAEREAILKKYKAILQENMETIAQAISDEMGKPLWEARMEADRLTAKVDISIEAYQERTGHKESEAPTGKSVTVHKPHGVVAVFGPFNFPAHLINAHAVPALLAGNTLVIKPSEITPYVGELIVKYFHQAGVPEGAVNIVQGARETGEALSSHPDLNGLFFTGSYQTGRILHELFAGHPEKILALEMGGNNPLIVADPGDTKGAVLAAIQSSFITSGQRCTCGRRIIVLKGKKGDEFVDAFVESLSGIRVAPPRETPEPFMGSVVSVDAANKILERQKAFIEKGAKPLKVIERLPYGDAFLSPGILDSTGMEVPDEEVFGPLARIIRVDTFEEAIKEANNTNYGLSSALLCEDPDKFKQFYQEIRAGIVNWNNPTTGIVGNVPFGGIGYSGNHRPSAYYAADYCAYPSVGIQKETLTMPDKLPEGITL